MIAPAPAPLAMQSKLQTTATRTTLSTTTVVTLVVGAVSGVVAWRFGGAIATGIVAGFCTGAFISGLCIARLMHAARKRPQDLLRIVMESFLVKLAVLLCGALAFGLLAPLARVVDVRGFLIAFAAAAMAVTLAGTRDTLKLANVRRAQASESGATPTEARSIQGARST